MRYSIGEKRRRIAAGLFLLCTALLAGPVHASDAPQRPAPPVKAGDVIWQLPTADVKVAPSEEQKALAQSEGRALPKREFLQPSLDETLPSYVPTSAHLSGKLVARASDILPGLVDRWIDAFRLFHPDVEIIVQRPYAGSLGAIELIKGNVDIVFVSRELKPSDISEFEAKFGYPPTSVPVSGGSWRHFGFLDSLAFLVHPDNPIRQLSYEQIDSLFSSTRHHGGKAITTWGQLGLGGKWSNKPIHLYGIAPWNGFEEFIRQRVLSVSGKRGEWADGIEMDPTFFPVARRIAADPYGLGYTGLSVVDSQVKVVSIAIKKGGQATSPTYENVAMAQYPLTRLIYLNSNQKPGAKPDPIVTEFTRFIQSKQGQNIVLQQGIFLPLRSKQFTSMINN